MIPSTNILILSVVVGIVLASSLSHIFAIISQDISIFSKKRVCESCGADQALFHRIPILSAFYPPNGCSACGHETPRLYGLLELLIFGFTLWAFSATKPALAFQISSLFFALIGVSYMDLKKWIIPNEFVVYIIAIGVFGLTTNIVTLSDSLLGLALASMVSLLIVLPQRFGSGDQTLALGDVKLCLAVALWLGWILSAYVFFLASVLAFITWVFSILFKGFSPQRRVPFGPFVALSTMIFGIGRVLDPQFLTHLLTLRF